MKFKNAAIQCLLIAASSIQIVIATEAIAITEQPGPGNGWIPGAVSLSNAFFAGSHNAPFSSERGWLYAQQSGTIKKQLEAGARIMKTPLRYFVRWDLRKGVKKESPKLVLSHETGALKSMNSLSSHIQKGTLSNPTDDALSFMQEVKEFLLAKPLEVMILILETHNMLPSRSTCTQDKTTENMKQDIVDLFEKSGLNRFAHKLGEDGKYPTFGELRHSGKRLVVFSSHIKFDLNTQYTNPTKLYAESDYQSYRVRDTQLRTKDAEAKGKGTEPFFIMNNFHPASCWRTSFYQWLNGYEHLAKRVAQFKGQRPLTDAQKVYIPENGYQPNAVLLDFFETGDAAIFQDAMNLHYISMCYPELMTDSLTACRRKIGETRMRMLTPDAITVTEGAENIRERTIRIEEFSCTVFGPHVPLTQEDFDKISGADIDDIRTKPGYQDIQKIRKFLLNQSSESAYIDDNTRRLLIHILGNIFMEEGRKSLLMAFNNALLEVSRRTDYDLTVAYGEVLIRFLPQLLLFNGAGDAAKSISQNFEKATSKTQEQILEQFNVPMHNWGAALTYGEAVTDFSKIHELQLARKCLLAAIYCGKTSLNVKVRSSVFMNALVSFFGLKFEMKGPYNTPLASVSKADPFIRKDTGHAVVSFLQLDKEKQKTGATVQGFKVNGCAKGALAFRLCAPNEANLYPGGELEIAAGDVDSSRTLSGALGGIVGMVSPPNFSAESVPMVFPTNLHEPFLLTFAHSV